MTESKVLKSRCARRSKGVRRAVASALISLSALGAGPAAAQDYSQLPLGQLQPGSVISGVLTVDTDRLFNGSAFGQRVVRENAARREALASENRQLETDLEIEEETLTQQRAGMDPQAFRKLADDFDTKVGQFKTAQLAKEAELARLFEQDRGAFLNAAAPILQQLMRESGASIIVERRFAFIAVAEIDVTDRAIALLNDTIGGGAPSD